MQARTWLQKLTDESSLWFNAVKAEDNGDFVTAASFYLKDAMQSAKKNSHARQALSTSCAANCLARIGAFESKQLYAEAAKLFLKNSERIMSESIREALWSLEEAFENLIMAQDLNGARELRIHYLALASRKSPFSSKSEIDRDLDVRESAAQDAAQITKSVEIPAKLQEEIKNALKQTRRDVMEPALSPSILARSIALGEGSRLNEKGIAS